MRRNFYNIALNDIQNEDIDRDVYNRLFKIYSKFAPKARKLSMNVKLDLNDYIAILSRASNIESLEIIGGTAPSDQVDLFLYANPNGMQKLTKLRSLKIQVCDYGLGMIFAMLPLNIIKKLEATTVPIGVVQVLATLQKEIMSLSIINRELSPEDLMQLQSVVDTLKLSKLVLIVEMTQNSAIDEMVISIQEAFGNAANPASMDLDDNVELPFTIAEISNNVKHKLIDNVIGAIISKQPNLVQLEVLVEELGEGVCERIFDASASLKTVALQVPNRPLLHLKLIFDSTSLENITFIGPQQSCVMYEDFKADFAKPSLKEYFYKFLD